MAGESNRARELVDRARRLPPEDQTAFLREACGDDEELRTQVDRLFAAEALPRTIEAPDTSQGTLASKRLDREAAANRTLPTLLDRHEPEFDGRLEPELVLQQRYSVVTLIGHGGMGAVYTATDQRLKSTVALKQRLGRSVRPSKAFEHEGQILSNLRHSSLPVVTDYFVDQHGEFLVMQYIAGKDMWQRLQANGQPFAVDDVLDWGEQLLRVLEYLHGQPTPVLHRDIKPQNLKLAPDGNIILLDFGLSKGATALMSTAAGPQSVQGYTPHFAPLEQIRGSGTDGRCDLYGLGATLYFLVTGVVPPDAVSRAEASLDGGYDPLAPASELNPSVSPAVADLLRRAMALKREGRPESAAAMRRELVEIRRQIDRGGGDPAATAQIGAGYSTLPGGEDTSEGGEPTAVRSEAEPTVGSRGRYRTIAVGAVCLVAALAVIGIGMAARRIFGLPVSPADQRTPPQLRFSRFTVSGNVLTATISRDGRYVAYVTGDGAGSALWVREVASSSAVQVVPPSETSYKQLAISTDGSSIRYVTSPSVVRPGDGSWSVYQVPIHGGEPRVLVHGVESSIDLGGDRLAYIRAGDSANDLPRDDVFVAAEDGTGERLVGSLLGKGVDSLALSGDGARVALAIFGLGPNADRNLSLVEVPADGGEERPVGATRWDDVAAMAWAPDGESLLVSAKPANENATQIWRIAYPSGEAEQVTNDLNSLSGLSLSADAATVCSVQVTAVSGLRISDIDDASHSRFVSRGTNDGMLGVAWTPDGRFVYTSGAAPDSDLWVCAVDGTEQRQLTLGPGADVQPALSSDGTMVYFASNRSGSFHVFSLPIGGGEPLKVTDGGEEIWPQPTSDGGWVLFESYTQGGPSNVSRTPVGRYTPTPLFEMTSSRPCVSPDGRSLAFRMGRPGTQLSGICTSSLNGSDVRRVVPIATTALMAFDGYGFGFSEPAFRWTPDGRGLVYTETSERGTRLVYQAVAGGRPKPLAEFEEQFGVFDLSPDGRQIVYPSLTYSSDVVLGTGLARQTR